MLALGRRQAAAIVVNDDADNATLAERIGPLSHNLNGHPRRRPFAGIVDEIADHLFEIGTLAVNLPLLVSVHLDGQVFVAMDLLHRTRERGYDRYNLANRTDHGKAGGEPSALEVTCHLVAHDIDLFKYLLREWLVAARRGFIHHHRQWRLQRMSEIADMCARTLNDFLVGFNQGIGFARERSDFFGKFSGKTLGAAGANSGKAIK